VPNVVGKRLTSAKRTIANRHCSAGKIRYAYSGKRKREIVLSQSRRPGRVLPTKLIRLVPGVLGLIAVATVRS
jgi:beta-lactam-binding protein with PASTA domain